MPEDSVCLQILYLEDQANRLASELPTALTPVSPLLTRRVHQNYMLPRTLLDIIGISAHERNPLEQRLQGVCCNSLHLCHSQVQQVL